MGEGKLGADRGQPGLERLLDRLLGVKGDDRIRYLARRKERFGRKLIVACAGEQLACEVSMVGHQPESKRPCERAACTSVPRTSRQSSA
jgi:hypothetical protein